MNDRDDRFKNLTPEQRRLLEIRLRERGLDGARERSARGNAAVGAPADPIDPGAWRARPPERPLRFSLYFFSDDGSRETGAKYRLTLESARFADDNGFEAVWTPERHFQPFGGLYPNPSVLGAALAAVTTRVGIRAGSVALPLHNPIRVAEEWSVVDNLSNGRVAISFASGWHPDDFVLYPSPYEDRKEVMVRGIETIRRLWAGDSIVVPGPAGRDVQVRTLPRPIQPELPVWITSAGSVATWERAGSIGANVLAALVGYSPEDLADHIGRYRSARAAAGYPPRTGIVTLVAHTYVGTDNAAVREQVREPMTAYLKTYLKQFQKVSLDATNTLERDTRDVAALAFEHYFESSTLLGTQNKCARILDDVAARGVDEIACLIDFGLDPDEVLAALPRLAELREHYDGTSGRKGSFGGGAPARAASHGEEN